MRIFIGLIFCFWIGISPANALTSKYKLRHATVVSFNEKFIILKLNDGRKLRIAKSSKSGDLREGQKFDLKMSDEEIKSAALRH